MRILCFVVTLVMIGIFNSLHVIWIVIKQLWIHTLYKWNKNKYSQQSVVVIHFVCATIGQLMLRFNHYWLCGNRCVWFQLLYIPFPWWCGMWGKAGNSRLGTTGRELITWRKLYMYFVSYLCIAVKGNANLSYWLTAVPWSSKI